MLKIGSQTHTTFRALPNSLWSFRYQVMKPGTNDTVELPVNGHLSEMTTDRLIEAGKERGVAWGL